MDTPVVLITGALTGIGRATALAFAREGARVVVSGRREDAGHALASELRALGAEVEFIRADVRNEDDVRALVDGTVAHFGRLDAAVNNAGLKVSSVRPPNRPPRPTPPPSTRMCWALSSASSTNCA